MSAAERRSQMANAEGMARMMQVVSGRARARERCRHHLRRNGSTRRRSCPMLVRQISPPHYCLAQATRRDRMRPKASAARSRTCLLSQHYSDTSCVTKRTNCSTRGARRGMPSFCVTQLWCRTTPDALLACATDALLASRTHDSTALLPDPRLGGTAKLRRGRHICQGPSHLLLHAFAEKRSD